jgi:TolB-like protein
VDFEQGLNWCIRQLRAVLEDDAANPQFIETVPKRGYRFLAECKTNELDSSANVSRRVLGSRFAVIAAVCFLMGGLTALLWAHRPKTPTATVLVLPVDNFTGDEKNESMTDGITDEMIAGLGSAKPAELKVIDRLTAAKFKRSQECILHIGKQLHADFVLVSSLVPSARGPRLSAGLFRVTDNTQVWSTDAYGLPAVNTSSGNVASQIASLLLHR